MVLILHIYIFTYSSKKLIFAVWKMVRNCWALAS